MQNKDSFVMYTKYIDIFKELSDEQAGKLIKVILEYVNDLNPEPTGLIKIAFIPIMQDLKKDLVKWKDEKQKRSEAGKKGMESRYNNTNKDITNANNVSECYNKTNTVKNELTNVTDNVNVYVYDNVNVNNNNSNNIINNIITFTELPLNDGSLYPISEEKVDKWQNIYKAIDVKIELGKMKCWLEANPNNRKTKKGIERFIVSWLNRSQDKAPRVVSESTPIEEKEPVNVNNQEIDEATLNQFRSLMGG